MNKTMPHDCSLCNCKQSEIIFSNDVYQIILTNDLHYPGYLKVVTKEHIKELTDLSDLHNQEIYNAVIKCEKFLRKHFNPDKINLASFGNMVPHVHWHIIPRFKHDRHFPNPIWGEVTNPQYVVSNELNQAQASLIEQFKLYYK